MSNEFGDGIDLQLIHDTGPVVLHGFLGIGGFLLGDLVHLAERAIDLPHALRLLLRGGGDFTEQIRRLAYALD